VAPSVIETIATGVREVAPDACIVVAPSEPIVGAALLGLDALAADAGARTRARAELDAAVGSWDGRLPSAAMTTKRARPF
jgi:hypothetical protein